VRIGVLTERMRLGFGVDLAIHHVAEGLARRGHDVTVFAAMSDGTFESPRYRIVPLGIVGSFIFPRYEWHALRALRRIRGAGMDVFLVQTFPFFALTPFLGAPVLAVDYGVCATVGLPWWVRASFLYVRLTQHHLYYRLARGVVTISRYLRDRLPPALRSRARVIHPGADHYAVDGDPAVARALIRKRLGLKEEDVLLLYIGRLDPAGQPYKGTARLVTAFERLRRWDPRVQALMVGFGTAANEAWLERHGIHCWRSAPREVMGAVYAAADLYVTASTWEGFDLPLAEAQAAGRPAVALRVGAHPEVVRDGETACLVGDMEAFEAAVLRLVGDPGLRARMGAGARVWARRFSWAAAVEGYDQVLREVVGERGWTR
jgi:glycosyltransferase involved in cell wall biosynthesis